MKPELHLSIRTLVEQALRSGDLTVAFSGPNRARMGIRVHQWIQLSRPSEYLREVPVGGRIETEHLVIFLGGRIDGVWPRQDHIVLEEIKSTIENPKAFIQQEHPGHWAQLKCYGYFYCLEHDLDRIDLQMTYCRVGETGMEEVCRTFPLEELKDFFDQLIGTYLEWLNYTAAWRILRDESIQALDFPFQAFRAGQRDMAVAVYTAIRDHEQLLAQAPTGVGKTMAVLFPAIKALGQDLNTKIFYLTARTTGRFAAMKALTDLRRKGLRIKSLVLTAKEKICFTPASACIGDECAFARGHFDRVEAAVREIFEQDDIGPEVIEDHAKKHRVCPFELSLDLIQWVDIVVCDINYAFDPRVYLKRVFQGENSGYTFLADEAHNLPDRARQMFSAELCKQPFLDLRRALKQEQPALFRLMGRVNRGMLAFRKKCEEKGRAFSDPQPPEALFEPLKRFLAESERWLVRQIKRPYRELLLDLYFQVLNFMRVADQFDQAYTTCYERTGRDLKITLFCIDPADRLSEVLKRAESATFFSATLTPADYFTRVLGFSPSAETLSLPSPFPRKHLGLFLLDRVSTRYRERTRTSPEIGQALTAFVRRKTGNYLVYFPSYEYMNMVHQEFLQANPDTEVIVQRPAMSEADREGFLDRFRAENEQTLVGFAVMGGIFGEGIDLVGDRLTGAVIVGVGLPAMDVDREVIRQYYAGKSGQGFEFAYLYPGINRVLQAAGRVIRSEKDRGAVLLIDDRFSTPSLPFPVSCPVAAGAREKPGRFGTEAGFVLASGVFKNA